MGAARGAARTLTAIALLAALAIAGDVDDPSASFVAAVFEHHPISRAPTPVPSREDAVATMQANLDIYEQQVIQAKRQGAQIIVFPEDGLFGDDKCQRDEIFPYLETIPAGSSQANPCLENYTFADRPVLRRASCLARDYAITLVLDMGDLQYCNSSDPNCPADGRYQFNTQVAFSTSGQLLAKYHKTHLFYEPQYNFPAQPDPQTFTTDFGVTFGMLVCFDLMFGTPALDYLQAQGVQHVVYSTWWINTPPFFSATQYQQAWSRTFNATILAAGNGNGWLYTGSGIFSRGAVLAETSNPTNTTDRVLLTARVPYSTRRAVATLGSQPPVPAPAPAPATSTPEGPRQLVRQNKHHAAHPSMGHPVPFKCYLPPPARGVLPTSLASLTGPSSGSRMRRQNLQAKGLLTLKPFRAERSAAPLAVISQAGELRCTASVEVARSVGEWYVLMAYNGPYDGVQPFYTERFCALWRCLNVSDCMWDYVEYSTTTFHAFSITASLQSENATVFAMAAHSGMEVMALEDTVLQVDQTTVTARLGSPIGIDFNRTALNVALFSRVLKR